MPEINREYFKILLGQRLDDLLTVTKKNTSGMPDFRNKSPDFTDEASLESDRNLAFRIRERESKLIRKIEHALKKLEDGTFGICEECGKGISDQRLEARPIATLCIKCKQNQETEENHRAFMADIADI